jgi:hypothetical protein
LSVIISFGPDLPQSTTSGVAGDQGFAERPHPRVGGQA